MASEQLLAQIMREVRELDLEGGTASNMAESIVKRALSVFRIGEEWQSLVYSDVQPDYEDELSHVYHSAEELLSGMGTKAFDRSRRLYHRFVLSTEFEQVRAELDWRPA